MIHILHIFSTFAVGGPQRRLAQLANGLDGYTHTVTAMDGQYTAQSLLDAQTAIEPIKIEKNTSFDIGNIRRLRRLIRQTAADLVCTYNWGTMEAVAALRLNRLLGRGFHHIHFEDGFGPEETVDHQIQRRVLARRLLLRTMPVVVPSKTLMQIATETWSLPSHLVQHIPNGVDLVRFNPACSTNKKQVTIGAVGALRPEKNFSRLIEVFALARLNNARLLIAGEGACRAELEALIDKLGLGDSVELLGHIEDPSEFYSYCDIFALSSDTEQMPLTVLEAMASGLPILATDVGDIRNMVCEENKPYVLPVDNEVSLSRALQLLAGSVESRKRLGAKNRERVESVYSEEQMLVDYDKLFRSYSDDKSALFS
ncbi:MAG: glycosyltransferase family 4 protein [Pseudomonadota bacterium]